jgi:hypothetical protein
MSSSKLEAACGYDECLNLIVFTEDLRLITLYIHQFQITRQKEFVHLKLKYLFLLFILKSINHIFKVIFITHIVILFSSFYRYIFDGLMIFFDLLL